MSEQYPQQQNPQYNPQQPPPGWQPPAPPKRRHTVRNVFIVLGVLAVLGIGGCFAVVGSIGNEIDKQSNTVHSVSYKVDGTATTAMITYTTDGGTTTEQVSDAPVPWASKTLKVKGLVTIYQVSAQNTSSSGTVTCEIWVDGAKVKSAEASGQGAIASCDYTP